MSNVKDRIGIDIKVRSYLTPCISMGILKVGEVFSVASVNSKCFHIQVVKIEKRRYKFLEVCVDKELSSSFRVLTEDDVNINTSELL